MTTMTLRPISSPVRNRGLMAGLRELFARRKPTPTVDSREVVIAGHLTEFSTLVSSGQRDAALAKWTQLRDEPMIRIAMIARLRADGVDIEAFMRPARAQTMGEARRERAVAELVADLSS
jgi:hypothetical protein